MLSKTKTVKKVVSITVLGGDGEIGGNKILLEHKGTRVFLGFGMSFNKNSQYFCEFLNPREVLGTWRFLRVWSAA